MAVNVTLNGERIDPLDFDFGEARKVMFDTIRDMCKLKGRAHIREKHKPRKEPDGPVVVLSDEQIRHSKGLMARPFDTLTENVLWLVKHNGPISVDEMVKILKGNAQVVRATVCQLRHKHPIGAERRGMKKFYFWQEATGRPTVDITVNIVVRR